jgi:hypothetical protein
MEFWQRLPLASMGISRGKELMNGNCPVSRVNPKRSNDMPRDGANNFGLECHMQHAGYVDVTDYNRTDRILGRIRWKCTQSNAGQNAPISNQGKQ